MNIKLVDLLRQNHNLKTQIMDTLEKVVDAASFIEGEILENFEKEFAKFCNKRYAIGLNSGTDALKLALIAYGIGQGDEVITVPNSYFSTAMVISEVGAVPIFVDINPDTFAIDVEKAKANITNKTRAIIPVHLYGQVVDMDPLIKLAKEHGLIIIEDACQSHGAQYKGKVVPISETGAFSFYPGKNLGCFGDGGALVTDNDEIAQQVRYLRNDGSKEKYIHKIFGAKSRLDTLQAAILNLKLPFLDEWNNKRRSHSALYKKYLGNISQIKLPKEAEDRKHVFHLYVIETEYREQLQIYLQSKGVETGIHYPIPIHLQEPYLKQGFKKGDFPITEEKSKLILSLPMFPELMDEEIEYICKEIEQFFRNKNRHGRI